MRAELKQLHDFFFSFRSNRKWTIWASTSHDNSWAITTHPPPTGFGHTMVPQPNSVGYPSSTQPSHYVYCPQTQSEGIFSYIRLTFVQRVHSRSPSVHNWIIFSGSSHIPSQWMHPAEGTGTHIGACSYSYPGTVVSYQPPQSGQREGGLVL